MFVHTVYFDSVGDTSSVRMRKNSVPLFSSMHSISFWPIRSLLHFPWFHGKAGHFSSYSLHPLFLSEAWKYESLTVDMSCDWLCWLKPLMTKTQGDGSGNEKATFLRLFLSFLLTFFPTSFAARRLSHFLNLGTHALSQVSTTPLPGNKYNFFCRTSSCPATRYSAFSWWTCGQSQVVLLCRRMVSPFFKSIRPFSRTRCTLPWSIRSPPLRSVDWSCTLSTNL